MKKRNAFLMVAVAGMLFASGCQNTAVEEAGIAMTETAQMQETSQTEAVFEETAAEKEVSLEEEKDEIVVEGNNGVIRIGTTGTPYSELLMQAKLQLAQKGWDVQVEVYSDHEKINQDVLNGTLDAHLFAHQTYIDSYNDVYETELTAMAKICFEKYGIYSVLNEDLTNIKDGVLVGIPEDDTRRARALLFLQDVGYITLKEGAGLTAVMDDIVENPKNMQFITYTSETAEAMLKEADYCVMGADQAILAGLEPHKEVLKEETPSDDSASAMAAMLVTRPDMTGSEGLSLLEKTLKSEETQKYIEETYKGAWGLFP